jgi:pimeloyl-ACP methyl ester carboxylesterase
MTSVRLPGMVVESEGEGPPVIMLHGLGGTSNSFQPLLAPLAGFRIVRPDLPGAGRRRRNRSRSRCWCRRSPTPPRISASTARMSSVIPSAR